jgi:hypothetical protein
MKLQSFSAETPSFDEDSHPTRANIEKTRLSVARVGEVRMTLFLGVAS